MSGAPRNLGLWSSIAIVVANIIGAGVFTTSGFALADLGSREWVLAAWAVGGLIAMLGALSYGALAQRFPESGGEYAFLSATVHPAAGFLAGWISLLAGFTGPIAVAALTLGSYARSSIPGQAHPEWIATGVIVAAAFMHGIGPATGVRLQNLAVGIKLAAIVAFIVIGIVAPSSSAAAAAPGVGAPFDLGAFAVTLVWVSFAYSGWNAAVYVAGEIRDPRRNVPLALVAGTATVTMLYLGLNAVFVYAAPVELLIGRAEVGSIAAEALGGPILRRAMVALVALALFTSLSSMVMAGPRVYARMASDGLFPRFFRADAVPSAVVALQAGLAIVVVWSGSVVEMLSSIGFLLTLSSAGTVASLLAFRERTRDPALRAPGYPWVQLVYVASALGTSAFLIARHPAASLVGLATVAAGLPLYGLARARSTESIREE